MSAEKVGATPGPWRVQPVGKTEFRRPNEDGAQDLCIVAENGVCPGIVWEYRKEGETNARLIAASPDLLALAKRYASECSGCDGTGLAGSFEDNDPDDLTKGVHAVQIDCQDCADIRAVIDKAEGRA